MCNVFTDVESYQIYLRWDFLMDAVIQFRGTIYENGYGLIAQKVMRDKALPKQSKLIYAYMCSFASINTENGERTAFPSISLQCSELGMGEDTYYKWRKPLVDNGYISIEKRKDEQGKFDRNVYYIESVMQYKTPPKQEKEPYPKKEGTEEKPFPKKSGTENTSKENKGTNSNSSNSNSFISNRNNKDLYLNHMSEYIWTMKVPMQLKKFFSDRVKVLVDDTSFDLSEIEYFYNTFNDYINPNCSTDDVMFLNDIEFSDTMKKMYLEVDRPIRNMKGLIKTWVQARIHYKMENYDEHKDHENITESNREQPQYDFSKRQGLI